MSKNSKNARLIREARERNRTKGYKGPASTTPLHGKKSSLRNDSSRAKSLAEAGAAIQKAVNPPLPGAEILNTAGAAAYIAP
jgi:hypothetical protein